MRRWKDILRPLVVILLLLQVSVAYALPAGVHLNLCIGSNGHIDISQYDCVDNLSQPPGLSDSILYGEKHHNDCLDFAIGCVSSNESVLPLMVACSSAAPNQSNDWPPSAENYTLSFSHRIPQSLISTSPHLNGGTFPPTHLVFHRTVVLLI